jgi:hypothetical protein
LHPPSPETHEPAPKASFQLCPRWQLKYTKNGGSLATLQAKVLLNL